MSKPLTENQTGPLQTHSPRVALGEGIVQDHPPRKRQMTNSIKALPENLQTVPDHAPHHVPGFRIRPLGGPGHGHDRPRAWCLDFRHRGARFCKVIGHSDSMDEAEARRIAARLIAEVKTGAAHRPVAPHECRFEAFARLFFRRYAHNWKPVTEAGSRRACEAYLMPFFAGMDVRRITAGDVRRWFEGMRETPGAANRSLALLSVMMREAERYGYREAATNPCRGMRRYRLTKQERFLSDAEYRRLGDFMREQQVRTPLQVAMLRLYLLTGCRKSEIRTLKWSCYRVGRNGRRHLFLPDSKTGPKTVFLSEAARAVLDGLPRRTDYVFPSTIKRKRGRPRKDATPFFDIEFWKLFRDRAGLSGMRLHDLRHSYASLAIRNGVPLATLGRLLGHADPQTTLQYTHLTDDTLSAAVELVASVVTDANDGSGGGA